MKNIPVLQVQQDKKLSAYGVKVGSHNPVFETNYYSNSKKLVTRINAYDKCIHDNNKPYVHPRELKERSSKEGIIHRVKDPFIISH